MKTPALLSILAATSLTACATAPAVPEAPLTPYVCNGEPTNLTADYYTKGTPRAVLHIEDKQITLYPAPAASGVRYTTGQTNPNSVLQQADKPGSMVWWTKGSEAILYTVSTSSSGTAYEKQLANCTSNPQPLPMAPAAMPVSNPLPGTIPGTAPGVIYAPTSTPVTI